MKNLSTQDDESLQIFNCALDSFEITIEDEEAIRDAVEQQMRVPLSPQFEQENCLK